MTKADFYSECRQAISLAAEEGRKLATFHFLVLRNASMLESENPTEFCRAVDVPNGYVAEFTQMLALHRVMRERNAWVVQA